MIGLIVMFGLILFLTCKILMDQRKFMKEFDDLTTAVENLIAADEAETTLLVSIKASLDALLANPTGVSPTDVTALRDRVAAEIDKVQAAIEAAS